VTVASHAVCAVASAIAVQHVMRSEHDASDPPAAPPVPAPAAPPAVAPAAPPVPDEPAAPPVPPAAGSPHVVSPFGQGLHEPTRLPFVFNAKQPCPAGHDALELQSWNSIAAQAVPVSHLEPPNLVTKSAHIGPASLGMTVPVAQHTPPAQSIVSAHAHEVSPFAQGFIPPVAGAQYEGFIALAGVSQQNSFIVGSQEMSLPPLGALNGQ
jgi:hypothetical protein